MIIKHKLNKQTNEQTMNSQSPRGVQTQRRMASILWSHNFIPIYHHITKCHFSWICRLVQWHLERLWFLHFPLLVPIMLWDLASREKCEPTKERLWSSPLRVQLVVRCMVLTNAVPTPPPGGFWCTLDLQESARALGYLLAPVPRVQLSPGNIHTATHGSFSDNMTT